MNICVLLPCDENSDSPVAEMDIPYDPRPFLARHRLACHPLRKETAVAQVEALGQQGFDVFFNLYDGLPEEHLPGVEVVQTLERLGVAFTGARSDFFEPPRSQVKQACAALGLLTPRFAFVRAPQDALEAARALAFPLIVKHANSFCSIGLTPQSRVETGAELLEQAGRMIDNYGSALVEEFIEGREFTALVVENPDDPAAPSVYQPNEIQFPEGETFKHFQLKWVDYGKFRSTPVQDPGLDARLRRLTRQIFLGMNGSGYARVDIRMDKGGKLFVLDVNANCGLYYPLETPGSADLILMQSPGGHQAFTDLLLRTALQRAGRPPQSD